MWGFGLGYLILWLVLGIGWVVNIFKLVMGVGADPLTSMEVLRIIGIFIAPLGGIVGWF